ncbi:GDP-fucose synthetase [Candidatus Kaiserbacteria bacterium RIFCSPHIGHO2_01_FULL_50_13]|uniref:GDP-fucose synthetase n=1 Tax=Candidatus Kaiserbacteria bacterium RIFCSPLOWO2_01_FULL_50_24 TaxID=1798507 RepID=A0A1F6EIW0_9BACT|nr:MAG: GDP-fucose synthetase [Candidatus Kaiserbacteria bacterium RIFCSPHIGHO2_01_FULL_50_13]OGG73585.1 MAG: GDP-fucose synthetase [Candidatus Kaiserbacteria bacterium RIFCSPLOWO2_01_FULL_50_24]OGG81249.1 MAG: GDP-fucose synthetase [Candidatus Kaiserbacteria bacterium RIFCSPLOWO2_02_FULL_51_13]
MTIIVTGASGFLGRFLCEALEKAGHTVVRLDSKIADLTKDGSLDGITQPYDRIYHLAAWTQAGDFCLHHSGEQWLINQKINTNVLSWWHTRQPHAKLIAMGTSCAYDPALPLSEENYMRGEPIESLFTYAMTKRMLYNGLTSLHKQFGHTYLHLVPSTLYGPHYHTDSRRMHFIFDLIRKILLGKEKGEPVTLWGDGYQKRELVFASDFVNAALHLSDHVDNDIVNIGAGEEYSIREFAEKICAIVGFDPALIEYDTSRYVGARSKVLSVEKLRHLIPNVTFTSLDCGLEDTVSWFSTQPELLR